MKLIKYVVNLAMTTMVAFGVIFTSVNLLAQEDPSAETDSQPIVLESPDPYKKLYFSPHHQAALALAFKIYSRSIDLKTAFAETSVATDEDKIKKIRDAVIERRNLPALEIKVNTFKQFIDLQMKPSVISEYPVNEIPVEKLIELTRRQVFLSNNVRVQKQIDAYVKQRNQIIQSYVIQGITALGSVYSFFSTEKTVNEFRSEIENKFDLKVNEALTELNESKSVHIKILVKLLKGYFKRLPQKEKAELLFQLSQKPIDSSRMDLFLALIQNAGPQLQKLIQIKGRDKEIPKKFQEIFQRLESEVKSVSWVVVEAHLKKLGFKFEKLIYFERKPLGVGTMAQTHRVQFLDPEGRKKTVVIRFLKPGIKQKLDVDHKIFQDVLQELDNDPELKAHDLPSLSGLVEDIHKSVMEELDLVRTVAQQNLARLLYKSERIVKLLGQTVFVNFSVPWARFFQSEDVVMQELVFGRKPEKETDQYKEIYPDLYKAIANEVAEIWLEEAFFKSGFFHADLHQGNMLMKVTDPSININLLDFGMTGGFTPEQQRSAFLLGVGIKIKNAEVMAKHFLNLSDLERTSVKAPELQELIQAQLTILDKTLQDWSLEDWSKWMLKKGIKLEYEFLKLNRGLAAIESLLMDSKSDLDFEQIAQKVTLRNKSKVLNHLMSEKAIKWSDAYSLAEQSGLLPKSLQRKPVAFQCDALF